MAKLCQGGLKATTLYRPDDSQQMQDQISIIHQEPERQKASRRKLTPARIVFDDFLPPNIWIKGQEIGEKYTGAVTL